MSSSSSSIIIQHSEIDKIEEAGIKHEVVHGSFKGTPGAI
jgi:hypothetical protein